MDMVGVSIRDGCNRGPNSKKVLLYEDEVTFVQHIIQNLYTSSVFDVL